jgi:hypothetical protein
LRVHRDFDHSGRAYAQLVIAIAGDLVLRLVQLHFAEGDPLHSPGVGIATQPLVRELLTAVARGIDNQFAVDGKARKIDRVSPREIRHAVQIAHVRLRKQSDRPSPPRVVQCRTRPVPGTDAGTCGRQDACRDDYAKRHHGE